jgi:hypothetical protein
MTNIHGIRFFIVGVVASAGPDMKTPANENERNDNLYMVVAVLLWRWPLRSRLFSSRHDLPHSPPL